MARFLSILAITAFIAGSAPTPSAEQPLSVVAHPEVESPGESLTRGYFRDTHPPTMHGGANLWFPDTTELFWDDGSPEAYYVVSFPPGPNDRMAVRFPLPGSPPMKVSGGRFYTDNSVIPLQSFSVCRDAGGYPDVFHPIDQVDTVYGGYPGWGSVDFHGALLDSNDIWAVVHWIPGHVTGIGADSSLPDSNSYWCNQREALNWNLWTATDWMMRLSVADVTDSHDVTTIAVLDPPGVFLPSDTANPTAVFGNCGLSLETFDVTFDIIDSVGSLVYTSTNTLTLSSCEVETLTFVPEWVEVNEGMYTYLAYTSLVGDADPSDDTVRMQGLCTSEIVITYCGNYTNMGSSIIGSWATNRKYLVRMTPPVAPPFYIRRAQVFLVEPNSPLEYVRVCPDDGSGLPDTTVVLANADNISVTQSHTWATADFGQVEVTQPGDLWVIGKWPEGITEPHIGMEINSPSSERSWRYYFKYGSGHYENLGLPPYYREWYFRLIISVPPLGVAEHPGSREHRDLGLYCQPNPFRDVLNIRFQIPQGEEKTDLKIFDIAGRVVKRSLDWSRGSSLYSLVVWDGTDDRSNKLSGGIYFVQLRTAQRGLTQKTILLR